jgi:hypothetical protein
MAGGGSPTNMHRHLIEFDVRVAPEKIRIDPEDDRYRAEFLLRPDVAWPMSVDGSIWPSVFSVERCLGPRDEYATVPIDEVREDASPWLDLAKMRAWYEAHRRPGPRDVCIGVELLTDRPLEGTTIFYEMAGGILCGLSVEPAAPSRPPDGSVFLGFDVADAGGISGLMNCGYTPEEMASWRPTWGPRLNDRGLLSALEDAIAFREATDRRVEEHAPFWVYALWQLPE